VGSAVSFVDRTSFELMRRSGVSRAFALDSDFETAGFVLVS
jgi:predicted nucleic acid-binding protein